MADDRRINLLSVKSGGKLRSSPFPYISLEGYFAAEAEGRTLSVRLGMKLSDPGLRTLLVVMVLTIDPRFAVPINEALSGCAGFVPTHQAGSDHSHKCKES